MKSAADHPRPLLAGIRVLELADELGEYIGRQLAGLGADVVKVEPPQGEVTRGYGPFYQRPDPERSLHFWHYNLGKRSIRIDLDTAEGRAELSSLAATVDVIVDTKARGYLRERGLDTAVWRADNPGLVYARVTPFGDDGPWADYRGSDLIHLALGGVMMNCGYDPDTDGEYDTPPIAPQVWQAYHMAGEMAVMSIIAALIHRRRTGQGQDLLTSVHDAVSKNTETDVPNWVFLRQTHLRQTCRHSRAYVTPPSLSETADGRWVMPYRTYLRAAPERFTRTVAVLRHYGVAAEFDDPKYDDPAQRNTPETNQLLDEAVDALVAGRHFSDEVWRVGMDQGQAWAAVRRPEENLEDPHWRLRGSFADVEHPELGRSFSYVGARWYCEEAPWVIGSRPPLLGEHDAQVRREWAVPAADSPWRPQEETTEGLTTSPAGTPFALGHVKVVDFGWMLASAGAGRFLAAFGADVVKIEHDSHPDAMRFSLGMCPPGGRSERDRATDALPTPVSDSLNRGGSFMEINAGKRSAALDIKNPDHRRIVEDLIREADIVIEGFSPGAMTRMGFGYERLKELNPSIVYIQQSGFGEHGLYGAAKCYGPTAQAFSGLSEMSGLPDPLPPAGIGYSYLDWFGAYNVATATLAGLFRKEATGKGCHIDASQVEIGFALTGAAVLDASANDTHWSRYGNDSPYKPAAPHNVYRTAGHDRWIAIAAFDEEQWRGIEEVLGLDTLRTDPRFATLEARRSNLEELDRIIGERVALMEPFALMHTLQTAGVPAGVCQNAQDRCDDDPQLRALGWTVELDQTEIGRWPVKTHSTTLSVTPALIGGRLGRSGPNYGEHTAEVLEEWLGDRQIAYRR